MRELRKREAEVIVHDPYVSDFGGSLNALVKQSDTVVLMVKYDAYEAQSLRDLIDERAIPVVDGRNVWGRERYTLLGRGNQV
jgi:UDP-N-acetyl-D-mannosaminuronate dehydrogenase